MKSIWMNVKSLVDILFNTHHLSDAKKAANCNGGYWWHWKLAMSEVIFLALMTIGSIIHAFIPWALDFKLLEWRIARLKQLKTKLPDDPQLKKVHFDE
jgi:hypothetical protein